VEIRFSAGFTDPALAVEAIDRTGVRFRDFRINRQGALRFTLDRASVADHDAVIAALFDLDPHVCALVAAIRAAFGSCAVRSAQNKVHPRSWPG